ncbi:MAG: YceI family protein, partial [Actinomycetota bacterium]|nr:YceI family protein [Actinomycetota bacterium]
MTATTRPGYIAGTWVLDPTHSEITFSVKHLAISKVRGRFEKFDLTIVTATRPEDSTITATIDVASVNTGQKARDDHLRTSDFFLVEKYPTITFASHGIAFIGDEGFTVDGDLTMRGVTLPVRLSGELGGVVTDEYGRTKAGATATTVLNRNDFGVSWNAALEAGGFTLGDDVNVN